MTLPSGLTEIIEDFEAVEGQDKLELLLELKKTMQMTVWWYAGDAD